MALDNTFDSTTPDNHLQTSNSDTYTPTFITPNTSTNLSIALPNLGSDLFNPPSSPSPFLSNIITQNAEDFISNLDHEHDNISGTDNFFCPFDNCPYHLKSLGSKGSFFHTLTNISISNLPSSGLTASPISWKNTTTGSVLHAANYVNELTREKKVAYLWNTKGLMNKFY